ncbi:MAG: hypothetical protein IJ514_02305 [Clostridia bacterium]|nr:hypothetical protein [Clostridia bacterium]
MKNEEAFSYTYTAPTERERREVEEIRRKYQPVEQTQSDMQRLQTLDNKVNLPPMAYALSLGVIGTLIFGLGLTLILEWSKPVLGTLVALLGVLPIALAYPVHRRSLRKRKEKYAAEILALSEKILGEKK